MKNLQQLVFLAQSDTTVGLLSLDKTKLNKIKNRPLEKPCIECVSSLHVRSIRVPNRYKNLVRRAKKTTFILPNGYSFRVIKDSLHVEFIRKFGAIYSTSANKTNKHFDFKFAYDVSNVVVFDERDFFEAPPSKVLKIGKDRLRKLR